MPLIKKIPVPNGTGIFNVLYIETNKAYLLVCLISSTGSYLSSRAASSQVLSTYKGLTSVFGMGTGGPP